MVEQVPSAAALLAPRVRSRNTQPTGIVPGSVADQLSKYRPHSDKEVVDTGDGDATVATSSAGGADAQRTRSARMHARHTPLVFQ